MTRLGMAINLNRCTGCQGCSLACKMENNVPMGMMWSRVISVGSDQIDGSIGTYPNLTREYQPMSCQQCNNPACQSACPVGATFTDEMGRVLVDWDLCIGCRICMAACPYNARVFNWEEPVRDPNFNYGHKAVPVRPRGTVEKCTMCKERTIEGKQPMCVECCPSRARTFGDLDDPSSAVSVVIRENQAYQLLPELGTEPKVYYFK